MFAVQGIASIHTNKYLEFTQLASSCSPESPVSIFHVHKNNSDRRLLNLIAECSSLEPLTEYIQTERFKNLVSVINGLGSLESIKMVKYSESS